MDVFSDDSICSKGSLYTKVEDELCVPGNDDTKRLLARGAQPPELDHNLMCMHQNKWMLQYRTDWPIARIRRTLILLRKLGISRKLK